jgi:predicted transcriptional regulator
MKSFTEYLVESKRVYEFKIKIAKDCPKDCAALIKSALAEFHVEACSAGKTTPIQETQIEFPNHSNVAVTIFDVATNYPATSLQIANMIAEKLRFSKADVRVRNMKEEEELAINNKNSTKSGKSVLTTDYENSDNQSLVGEKKKENFLKELTKTKKELEQVKGVNDTLLAKKVPVEKQPKQSKTKSTGSKSPIGGK